MNAGRRTEFGKGPTGWDNIGRHRAVNKEVPVPSPMGYGYRSMGSLPGNAPMIFEVESMDAMGREGR